MDVAVKLVLGARVLDVRDDDELEAGFPKAFDAGQHFFRLAYDAGVQNHAGARQRIAEFLARL